jgi:hypothetical protein
MNEILKEVLGREVEVRSQAGDRDFRDDGKLVAYDERWIKIEVGANSFLYFPIANVRLLKPL